MQLNLSKNNFCRGKNLIELFGLDKAGWIKIPYTELSIIKPSSYTSDSKELKKSKILNKQEYEIKSNYRRQFEFEHLNDSSFQPVATVNYPNEFQYTRITEMKKLTGQTCDGTTLVSEYPTNHGDPYYPIPTIENAATYKKYQELAESEEGTSFVGRLAQYKYFNMDQVVGSALDKSEILTAKLRAQI